MASPISSTIARSLCCTTETVTGSIDAIRSSLRTGKTPRWTIAQEPKLRHLAAAAGRPDRSRPPLGRSDLHPCPPVAGTAPKVPAAQGRFLAPASRDGTALEAEGHW